MKTLIDKVFQILAFTVLQIGIVHAQLYVGVGAGQTSMEIQTTDYNFSDIQQMYVVDFNDKYYKIFGGWKATPSLMLEFGYTDLGQYTENYSEPGFNINVETNASAYYAVFIGRMELGKSWNFLGKLGLAYWNAEVDYEDISPFTASESGNGFDPILGIGFEYNMDLGARKLGVRMEWEQYQNFQEGVVVQTSSARTHTYNGTDINTFGLSAVIEF